MLDLDAKRFAEARDKLREAIVWQKKALAAYPRHPQYRQFLANHLTNLRLAAQGLQRFTIGLHTGHGFRPETPDFVGIGCAQSEGKPL